MWQRIQTIYLILVILLMTAGILLPSAEFFNAEKNITYLLDSRGIIEITEQDTVNKLASTNPLTFLFGLILFVTTFSIFKFQDRKKQFRLATISTILILIYIIAFIVFIFYAKNKLNADFSLQYPAVFPVIALILSYLAMRGISKDEKLVRSLDRLR